MLLDDRNAVVYGGGGSVGGAVAGAFAREGARVFLAGRNLTAVKRVAEDIAAEGGTAEAAQVDALDVGAVERHAEAVAEQAGSIDISFNAVSYGDVVHGQPLVDMSLSDFIGPVTIALTTQLVTARAAARHMVDRRSGVIMTITATTSRMRIPHVGSTGVTFDAIESLCRLWATELGPLGVRVVWLRTTGIPDALHADVFPPYGPGSERTREEHIAWMRAGSPMGRLTTLADVGHMAAFMASDRAGAMTGCAGNITCGMVPG